MKTCKCQLLTRPPRWPEINQRYGFSLQVLHRDHLLTIVCRQYNPPQTPTTQHFVENGLTLSSVSAIGWATDAVFAARRVFVNDLKEARAQLLIAQTTTKSAGASYRKLKDELDVQRRVWFRASPNFLTFEGQQWRVKREEVQQALRQWVDAEAIEKQLLRDLENMSTRVYKANLLVRRMESIETLVREQEPAVERERWWNPRRNSF